MRWTSRSLRMAALILCGGLTLVAPTASAQGPGSRGSLGGYGGSMTGTGTGTGPGMGGSGLVIPYGGMAEGFMPSRMGGGNSLGYRPRSSAAMGSARTSFSLAPMSGGTSSSMGGGMGQVVGSRARMASPFGSSGPMGPGGMGRRAPGSGGMGGGVMPPSFGYPFRQPPSLLSPSSSGAGMSM